MNTTDEPSEDTANEFKSWRTRREPLSREADATKTDAQPRYGQEIAAYRAWRHTAMETINDPRASRGHPWDTVKEISERVWCEMRGGFHDAVAKFTRAVG